MSSLFFLSCFRALTPFSDPTLCPFSGLPPPTFSFPSLLFTSFSYSIFEICGKLNQNVEKLNPFVILDLVLFDKVNKEYLIKSLTEVAR